MKLNIAKIPKDELIARDKWQCPIPGHSKHSGLEHPRCYDLLHNIAEKVATLDCETTGLNGNWDYVISYALYDGKRIYGRVLTPPETINYSIRDKKLVQELYEDIIQFSRIVVYWGKDRRHDIPFLRTRALANGARFPIYKEVFVTDLYDIVKGKLRLHRNRLENAAQFMKVPAKQHRMDEEIWGKAKLGDKKALQWIWLHNKEDVVTTWEVYQKLRIFVREPNTSI